MGYQSEVSWRGFLLTFDHSDHVRATHLQPAEGGYEGLISAAVDDHETVEGSFDDEITNIDAAVAGNTLADWLEEQYGDEIAEVCCEYLRELEADAGFDG